MTTVDTALTVTHREEWTRIVAGLARRFGGIDIDPSARRAPVGTGELTAPSALVVTPMAPCAQRVGGAVGANRRTRRRV
ncbi:hypothetical protein [Microbacterium memoriense]|uniref:Uncharacterized protein n=1 Tax=Microbacterium memoriense TaxID=2978350 RepID=A0ABT2PEX3_9MICO|nr:hypothetical protein [Microbacterium memoriense]MCT9002339.1 hypothetical protein [Microbacterium memoriense]